MEHFINIVMDKREVTEQLDESVFPNSVVLESEQNVTIYQIPLDRELTNEEADEYANRLSNYMFSEGYDDFDIEVSLGNEDDIVEETYEDDDEFYEQYGTMHYNLDDDSMDEAEYQGRKVKLGKPMQGDVKKFKVYVKDPKTGNTKKVNFGDPNMEIRRDNPAAKKSFRARHNCSDKKDRTKAGYWSCRMWSSKPVSKIV